MWIAYSSHYTWIAWYRGPLKFLETLHSTCFINAKEKISVKMILQRHTIGRDDNSYNTHEYQPLASSAGIWSVSRYMTSQSGGLTFAACDCLSENLSISSFCRAAIKLRDISDQQNTSILISMKPTSKCAGKENQL